MGNVAHTRSARGVPENEQNHLAALLAKGHLPAGRVASSNFRRRASDREMGWNSRCDQLLLFFRKRLFCRHCVALTNRGDCSANIQQYNDFGWNSKTVRQEASAACQRCGRRQQRDLRWECREIHRGFQQRDAGEDTQHHCANKHYQPTRLDHHTLTFHGFVTLHGSLGGLQR